MKKFLMGCAVAATVTLSPTSEAKSPARDTVLLNEPPAIEHVVGIASWYGEKFHGRPTASGEPYDMNGFTAAHWGFPLGTRVRVTNLKNNRVVTLRINDRGPSIPGRMLDVSKAAAISLGFLRAGLTPVRVEVIARPAPKNVQPRPAPAPVAF